MWLCVEKSDYVVVLGECGCATKIKLALSLLSGTIMAGLAESLALTEKVGLSGQDFTRIIQMSNMNCPLILSIAEGKA